MVPPLLDHRVSVAVVDYELAPRASLARIIDQCIAATSKVIASAARLGLDPQRVVVAGSSAGGHLAAAVVQRVDVAGAVLLSGVFDLEPLVGTYINEALGLDGDAARALSPIRWLTPGIVDSLNERRALALIVAVGANETTEFHRQSLDFAIAARVAGHRVAHVIEPHRHHFDVPGDLGNQYTELGRHTLSLLHHGVVL
jgi:arylformamidase